MSKHLTDLISGLLEPSEPYQTILMVFERYEGKRLDKRFVGRLSGIVGVPIKLHRLSYGAYLRWGDYPNTQELYLGIDDNLAVSPSKLQELNPSHYAGREERNAKRRELLDNSNLISNLEDVARRYREIRTEFEAAMSRVDVDEHSIREFLIGSE